jgi:hypothetical protein
MSGLVGADGTYDGIIGDMRPLQTKMIAYKHEYEQGDGSISLTGCGFAPTACVVIGGNQPHAIGMGMASKQGHTSTPTDDFAASFAIRNTGIGNATEFGRFNNTEGIPNYSATDGQIVYRCSMGSGQTWYLAITSWDVDGATFQCETVGTNTADLEWGALFLR